MASNETFTVIPVDEWAKIPVIKPEPKPSKWDDAIQQLIDGNVISIPVANDKELRGARIVIARRANSLHEIKLDFRHYAERHRLAVRLSEKKEKPAVQDTAQKHGPVPPTKS